ncbi:Flagellar hook-basal body complex protein FliE [Legionella massiliensis]|uniref:Flagellar hook-basal body complex protein FliE n=1 Tax=Legionella massiliensis TaxID=1034943 RepID=A0A078L0B7_9GAMM|nr:flagellar hook-basal body complex protein FliE [Legionella massiliensis]CDZ78601.1 Flagellar hook-basal body complex protein FliE [Legionella massiliensis]CEE14339.1 Flagellar hook-basal body complex protein FliE [Legionella massiliensis]
MSDVNTISLMNQMRLMSSKAAGSSVEFAGVQESFGEVFQNALNETNQLQQSADALKARFEVGDSNVGIGEVMIQTQKADIAFQATLSVRNKLIAAYEDIMNMSI